MADKGKLGAARHHGKSIAGILCLGLAACGGSGGGEITPTLSYARNPVLYPNDLQIPTNSATFTGSATSFAISPALPDGLSFNTQTGAITGKPTTLRASRNYTITAQTADNAYSASLRLGIVETSRFMVGAHDDDTLTLYMVDGRTGELEPLGFVVAPAGELGLRSIAAHPSGEALYGINRDSDDLSVYRMDEGLGMLSPAPPTPTGDEPRAVAMHPSGEYVYVANYNDGTISAYAIDASTFALTALGSIASGQGPTEMVLDGAGENLYVTNELEDTLSAFSIDGSGALTSSGAKIPTGTLPGAPTLTADGAFLFVANTGDSSLTRAALNAGRPEAATQIELGYAPKGTATEPTGRFFYVAAPNDNLVHRYELETGAELGALESYATGARPETITVDAAGRYLYLTNYASHEISGFQIRNHDGALLDIGGTRTRPNPMSLALINGPTLLERTAKFATVLNASSSDLTLFAAQANNGGLQPLQSSIPAPGQPRGAVADRTGRFLFVANEVSNTVTTFELDSTAGTLTALSPSAPTGNAPQAVAVDPSNTFVYTVNNAHNTLSVLRIESDGRLTLVATIPTGSQPNGIAFDPSGRFAFVSNTGDNTVSRFRLNARTGVLSEMLPRVQVTGRPAHMKLHPSGRFLYVALENVDVVANLIVNANGTLDLGPAQQSEFEPTYVAIEPAGQFAYVANYDPSGNGNVAQFWIDQSTGLFNFQGDVPSGLNPVSLAVHPTSKFLYSVNETTNDVTQFSINTTSGLLTETAAVAVGANPSAIILTSEIQE